MTTFDALPEGLAARRAHLRAYPSRDPRASCHAPGTKTPGTKTPGTRTQAVAGVTEGAGARAMIRAYA